MLLDSEIRCSNISSPAFRLVELIMASSKNLVLNLPDDVLMCFSKVRSRLIIQEISHYWTAASYNIKSPGDASMTKPMLACDISIFNQFMAKLKFNLCQFFSCCYIFPILFFPTYFEIFWGVNSFVWDTHINIPLHVTASNFSGRKRNKSYRGIKGICPIVCMFVSLSTTKVACCHSSVTVIILFSVEGWLCWACGGENSN